VAAVGLALGPAAVGLAVGLAAGAAGARSEEHTSELQSHSDLVCRLLLVKNRHWPTLPAGGTPRQPGGGPRLVLADVSSCGHPCSLRPHATPAVTVSSTAFFFFKITAAPRISPPSRPPPFPI